MGLKRLAVQARFDSAPCAVRKLRLRPGPCWGSGCGEKNGSRVLLLPEHRPGVCSGLSPFVAAFRAGKSPGARPTQKAKGVARVLAHCYFRDYAHISTRRGGAWGATSGPCHAGRWNFGGLRIYVVPLHSDPCTAGPQPAPHRRPACNLFFASSIFGFSVGVSCVRSPPVLAGAVTVPVRPRVHVLQSG